MIAFAPTVRTMLGAFVSTGIKSLCLNGNAY
jgi:hypothetical protein